MKKQKQKMSSSKKILISSILAIVLIVGAILSLVLVLAAPQQNFDSGIIVNYEVDDVGAIVDGTYATVPLDGTITKVDMDGGPIEFFVSDTTEGTAEDNRLTTEKVELSSDVQRVVYEYKFKNTSEKAFTIELTNRPTPTNMKIRYKVSATELDAAAYRGEFENENLAKQVLMNIEDEMYIYIIVTINQLSQPASYLGDVVWNLSKIQEADRVNVTLNNNGGTGGLTQVAAVKGAAVPFVKTLPKSSTAGTAFAGYVNGASKYVAADGEGIKVIADAMTLTAEYSSAPEAVLAMQGGVVKGISPTANGITALNIPAAATEIAAGAFENQTHLTEINFEDEVQTASYANGSNLKRIGENAFKGCTRLKELVIPEGVTKIGEGALQNLTELTHLVLPTTLTWLEGVKNYEGINIPSDINYPFAGTENIEILECNAEVIPAGIGDARQGIALLGDLSNLSEIVINSGTLLRGSALYNSPVEKITLPNTLFEIGDFAIYSCANISEITIPDSVTTIGNFVFAYCSNLASVIISDSVTTIGAGFAVSSGLISITIPDSVTKMGSIAFNDCYNLKEIKLSNSLMTIESSSFVSCTSLTYIKIPESVKVIGSEAFDSCTNLIEVIFLSSQITLQSGCFVKCNALTEIVIPSSVIEAGVFANCGNLRSIILNGSVESIDSNAFYNCTNLSNIYYQGTEEEWNAIEGIADVSSLSGCTVHYGFKINSAEDFDAYNALSDADKEKYATLIIGGTVTTIPEMIFINNEKVVNVIIQDSVTEIGMGAFGNCSNLVSIKLPNSIITIGNSWFAGCSKLKNINIPDSVTTINGGAFQGCSSLTKLDLSDSVTTIEGGALQLTGITEIKIPSSITTILNGAFVNCTELTKVIIPNSVTKIEESAFYNCVKLVDIYYQGTQAEWNEIIIETDAFLEVSTSCTIHCTDGDITIS